MSPVPLDTSEQHQGVDSPSNLLDTGKKDLPKLFWMLGLAITLPMVLLSGPLAGYLISAWLIQKWHYTPTLTLILVLVGLCGSVIQTVRILSLLYKGSEKKDL